MSDDPDSFEDGGQSGHRDSLPTRRESAVGSQDSRVGEIVDGRYRIQKRIGAGGMGVVYQAQHTSLERTVVIKVLTEEKLHDEVSVQRFEREAKSLSRLDHSNIVTVYDFGRQNEQPYLAMEHVDGIELRAMAGEDGGMDFSTFSRIAPQIVDGMAHAHRQGLVHRDLKPSNIMLTERDGNPHFVKLLDFGLAKLASGGRDVTAENRVVGSMAYLAPEQITGSSVDQRADVYSLGIVFYWMLTGRKPFRGSRASIVYDQIHADPPPLALQLPADSRVPDNLVELINLCLSKNPDRRPRGAGDLQARLEETTAELRADEVPTSEMHGSTSSPGREFRHSPSTGSAEQSRRQTPGPAGSSGRQTPADPEATGRQIPGGVESRPVEPGTESSELVDEYQTDDRAREDKTVEDGEMTIQEAINSAHRAEGTEERTDEEAAGIPNWVLGVGTAVALAVLGGGGWYMASSAEEAATVEIEREAAPSESGSEAFEEQLGRVEELIAEESFAEAATRLEVLEAEAATESRQDVLEAKRRRLAASRLYAEAERQREKREIEAAMSTYGELLEIDPDFRDARDQLEELESYGLLEIAADEEATVRIDEDPVGETPLTEPIAPGDHEVLVDADDEGEWTTTVTVEEDETVSLAPVLEEDEESAGGSGRVESRPTADSDPDRARGADDEGTEEPPSRTEERDETNGEGEGSESSPEDEPVVADEGDGGDEDSVLLETGSESEESTAGAEGDTDQPDDESEKDDTELLPVQ